MKDVQKSDVVEQNERNSCYFMRTRTYF